VKFRKVPLGHDVEHCEPVRIKGDMHDVQVEALPLQVAQVVLHDVHTAAVDPEAVFAKDPVGHALRQEVPFWNEPTGQETQVLMVPWQVRQD
jgi:hypothetical protein